jgi:diguanylate cyclase (GGDEF)-like protein
VGTVLGGLVVVTLPRLPASPGQITPPWWLLAAGFAVCDVRPFRVRVNRRELVIGVESLPLVVGLFALTPGHLLLARLAGALALLAVLRGRTPLTPLRVAFGLALAGLQAAVAGGVMWLLAGGNDALTVRGWCAALVAVTLAEVLDDFVLLPGGRLHHRWQGPARAGQHAGTGATAAAAGGSGTHHSTHHCTAHHSTGHRGAPRDCGAQDSGVRELTRSLTTAVLVGLVGLLMATVLALGSHAAWPAGPALLALVLGYRVYLLVEERHERQERQLLFTERLREAAEVDDVARVVVGHVTQLIGARRAELVIGRRGRFVGWAGEQGAGEADAGQAAAGEGPATPGRGLSGVRGNRPGEDPGGFMALFSTPAGGVPIGFSTPAGGVPIGQAVGRASMIPDGEAVLAAGTRLRVVRGMDGTTDHLLERRDLQEALVLPLGLGDGMSAALLVGERAQALLPGYRDHDLQLLHAVANQASLALQHVAALERLRHEATHDQLTGLPNRQQFRRQAVRAVTEAASLGPSCAVGVLDLDGFKTVNDSLGHLAGDAVLAEVGRRMAALQREGLQVSRLGGDEFAVLVRAVRDESEAVAVARRLLDSLHEPFEVMGDQVRLTGSLGLALAPRDGLTPEQLLRHADVAMYAAKEEAGGVRVYARELTEMLDAPLSLAADLRLALARGDVTIAVQPLVDLATGRLHSVEALARWRHPVLGVVNPEVFVMAAERVGLVGELTDVVIDQALRACADWLALGLEVQVAVNLAARTLSDPELPAKVEAALHRSGVPGRLLCFELTETGVISSPDRALAVLARLRELGVCLAVDDFGTGYSSMTYMNWLAPDQVKIDKSFVQRLRFDPRNEAIVRSIIDLAHNLGVEVVAEGVGDARTATRLADLGCTIGQGFLFAEPMQTDDLPDWVSRWMSVPERDELPDPEADPFAGDDVVIALGPATGPIPVPGLSPVAGLAPVVGGLMPAGASAASAAAAGSGGGPSGGGSCGDGDADEGEVRLHIVR